MFKINKKIKNKGFVLFLSLLIISVSIGIAFSLFEIFIFQLVLTGDLKNSQKAFYAADSGIECIYYSDINKDLFKNPSPITIKCNNNQDIIVTMDASNKGNFEILFTDGTCVKIILDFNNTPPYTHKIQSFGRSKYTGTNCDNPTPKRSERGMEVVY